METFKLSQEERKQALKWYINGLMLQTIADHFKITIDELKANLHTL